MIALEGGLSLGEVMIPDTRPVNAGQLSLDRRR